MISMTILKIISINLSIPRITLKKLKNKFIQVPRNVYFKRIPRNVMFQKWFPGMRKCFVYQTTWTGYTKTACATKQVLRERKRPYPCRVVWVEQHQRYLSERAFWDFWDPHRGWPINQDLTERERKK